MKKFFDVFFLVIFFTIISSVEVKAASFHEGPYVNNSYVIKEKNGVKYYLQIQYILDENGNYVYCIEPFKFFEQNQGYLEYKNDNFYNYSSLSKEQIRKIELISYLGYISHSNSLDNWYAITQVAIWKIVDPSANIYFTDRLNGNKIVTYDNDVNELIHCANIYDSNNDISFASNYTVNYGENLSINGIDGQYEIVDSTYQYTMDNGFYQAFNLENDGYVIIRKKRNNNFYSRKPVIFDTGNGQDLISPGDVEYFSNTINVKVTKARVTAFYEEQNDYYSTEAKSDDICYHFYKDKTFFKEMCKKDSDQFIFDNLPYGNYSYTLVKNGDGYIPDYNIYSVNVSDPEVSIKLPIVKMSSTLVIDKDFCKDLICNKEQDAIFDIYDINNSIVDTIKTDKEGKAKIVLGYGSYYIKQVSGLENYNFIEPFNFEVVKDNDVKNNYFVDDYVVPELEEKNENSDAEVLIVTSSDDENDFLGDTDNQMVVIDSNIIFDNPITGKFINIKLLFSLFVLAFATMFFVKIKAQ